MKPLIPVFSLVVASLWGLVCPIDAQVNVTQEHNHLSRDGLYIDSAFTRSAAVYVKRNLNFNGTISGNVYAQPLYVEGGPGGRAKVIVATESNYIYALDAVTGTVIWRRNVGAPVTSGLPCGNISPLGIGHSRCPSCLSITFLRCNDQWRDQKAFHFFIERGHGHDQCRLASRCERHR